MADEVRNPVFARWFPVLARMMEREAGRYREEMLIGLTGRAVEIGAGNGMNFPHYPSGLDEVVAVEPEPYLREKAEEAAAGAPVPVTVVDAVGDELPFGDDSFDAGVACLVLCSVSDPAAALAELRRVLKPGAELRFLEHVRSPSPRKARVQRALDRSRVWPLMAGGCHCSRDTRTTIERAGFAIQESRPLNLGPAWGHTNPHVIGRAA
jgi:ubiquinone/menaquinone biosynthesis C-methylase UbiE